MILSRLKKFIKMSNVERKYIIKKRYIPAKISSKLLTNYLLEKGVDIGKGTVFHDPGKTEIDVQRPWMLHIGEYCKITSGVTILTHDYSRSVLRRKYKDIVGEAGITSIGDNVFVGINSIILMGAKIGDNCIIGAGSVVSGKFPNNVVIAGNPARIIMSLDEFYQKRKKQCINSAKEYCREYYLKYHKAPMANEMGPFFPLFLEKTNESITSNNIWITWNGDDPKEILESFLNSKGEYCNYSAFLNDALKETDYISQ